MPNYNSRIRKAEELMQAFAERTGLGTSATPVRYLWTDAFALGNCLSLAREGNDGYLELAGRLVDQVHETLGHHREDDPRKGRLSCPYQTADADHPTRCGLRIGKPLPERGPEEAFDERLEWERDGQYFHYLSKWMHALDMLARETRKPEYAVWACDLAATAAEAFVYQDTNGRPRMHWKMSIDLSRPLVPMMGQHDPLDGLITTLQVQHTASVMTESESSPGPEWERLNKGVRIYSEMLQGLELTTTDVLGLGGLLMDATRLGRLMLQGTSSAEQLLLDVLRAAQVGLDHWAERSSMERPPEQRLAFRELGLVIGLQGIKRIGPEIFRNDSAFRQFSDIRNLFETLDRHHSKGEAILSFWLEPQHRQNSTWRQLQDINEVMLATALAPQGVLLWS